MNAETLRRAATSMRKRAKAATPGENWEHDTKPYGHADEASVAINYRPSVFAAGYVGTRANAAHIASWHPAVALAVADWLDSTANDVEHVHTPIYNLTSTTVARALTAARIYLGEHA